MVCYYSSFYRFWRTPNAVVLFGASRYFYLLYVFSTVSISLCLFRRGVSRRNAIIGGLVLIAVFAGSVSGYRIPPREPVRWKEHMNELQEKGKTSVVISPGGEWVMTIDKRK